MLAICLFLLLDALLNLMRITSFGEHSKMLLYHMNTDGELVAYRAMVDVTHNCRRLLSETC